MRTLSDDTMVVEKTARQEVDDELNTSDLIEQDIIDEAPVPERLSRTRIVLLGFAILLTYFLGVCLSTPCCRVTVDGF